MERIRHGIALMIVLAAVGLSGCAEQNARTSRIDPQADDMLHKMSDALSAAKTFSFRSATTMDVPSEGGQLVQVSRVGRIVVCRPDRLFAEIREGDELWHIWYTGSELTMFDQTANAYATVKVPGRIEAMLDEVAAKYGLTMPLADLLFPEPYKVLTANVLTGQYIDLYEVGKDKWYHLLFTQDNVTWQVWIDAEGKPLPRKVVIDYKHMPGRPQFVAMLSDWNLSASADDATFKPDLPQDAKKLEMAKLLKGE